MSRLNGSNGILFIRINETITLTPYIIESIERSLSVSADCSFLFTDNNTPLIPNPSRATLMIMNAK